MWCASVDLLYDLGGIFTSPKTAFKIMVAEGRSNAYSLLTLSLFSVATTISVATVFIRGLIQPFVGPLVGLINYTTLIALPILAITVLLADIIRWLFEGGIAYLLVKVFGGRASYGNLLLVIGYSKASRVFIIATSLASSVITGPAVLGLVITGFVITLIIEVIIESLGISVTQNLSVGASVATVILTLVIEFVVILSIALATTSLTHLITGWW